MMLAMLLMQILHKSTLGQLVVRATSTSRLVTFKLLSLLILESLRNRDISQEGWKTLHGGTLQIRFVNDS